MGRAAESLMFESTKSPVTERPTLDSRVDPNDLLGQPPKLARDVMLNWLAELLIRHRPLLLFVGHLMIFFVAYTVAMLLQFAFSLSPDYQQTFWKSLPFLLITKITVFTLLRSYNDWWRDVTFNNLFAIGPTTTVASVAFALVNYFVLPYQVPRAVILLDLVMTGILLGLVRSSWPLLREKLRPKIRLPDGFTGVLIISNHHETVLRTHQINSFKARRHRVVGILSDDKKRTGETRAGIPIVGCSENAVEAAARTGATEIWVVAGSISGTRLRDLKDLLKGSHLSIKIISPVRNDVFQNGKIPVRESDIRDLLQREAVDLDLAGIRNEIQGRRIMVTGAGGSIGSEICRQVMQFEPSDLILIDHRENSVFMIHRELGSQRKSSPTVLYPCVGDILDSNRMKLLFDRHRPEIVYHAAAHKHVELMERNAGEAIKNNVLGTRSVADRSHEFSVEKFVQLSTDKVVNPTSVMGATKQIAEHYIHALAQESDTAFIVVRFGNVLGSNGSVVPIFQEQIARGGPITITDRRMTRFFMTIPEASQLVIQAASMGKGGEIFVLEMGAQVPIVQLAKEMIRLAGLPQSAIDIQFMGMRPGEKLSEQLYFDEEQMMETEHPKVHRAYRRPCKYPQMLETIASLQSFTGSANHVIRAQLEKFVKEFNWNPGSSEMTFAPPLDQKSHPSVE